MKREGYLFNKICSVDNLILVDKKARKGKTKKYDVKKFDKNKQDNLINLHHILLNKEYKSYHTHILLRKSIKKNFIKMIKYNNNYKSKVSYKGWMCHANCINLNDKYYEFKKD